MIRMMTITLQATGVADRTVVPPAAAPLSRLGTRLRRAVGFAITVSGFAVIAAHLLSRAAG